MTFYNDSPRRLIQGIRESHLDFKRQGALSWHLRDPGENWCLHLIYMVHDKEAAAGVKGAKYWYIEPGDTTTLLAQTLTSLWPPTAISWAPLSSAGTQDHQTWPWLLYRALWLQREHTKVSYYLGSITFAQALMESLGGLTGNSETQMPITG